MRPTLKKGLKITGWVFLAFCLVILLGFLQPQNLQMPVEGATEKDYNPNSYWAYPWGKSVTHKGVDIFARKNTAVFSPVKGLVFATGHSKNGGNYVIVLGPKWRFHYMAHLAEYQVKKGQIVSHKSQLGKVGDTGNAKGKPPHLHYAIISAFPLWWKRDSSIQGWKKAIYLNPIPYLK